MPSPFQRDNHYVPCLYLKNFANPQGKINTYRILVSHPDVLEWKPYSIRGIGYHSHLYTRLAAGAETDEIEKWLEREFETPAAEAISRAVADDRLTPNDWETLSRFFAAQQVRTPAWFIKQLPEWQREIPKLTKQALEDVKAFAISGAKRTAEDDAPFPNTEYLPIRVTQTNQEQDVQLRADVVMGRSFWVFAMKHVLTSTLNTLLKHRWTILKPSGGLQFLTSDDPSVCVNFYANGEFDFRGAWGSPKTELCLPLGPDHLLYAQVGNQHPPKRGAVMPAHQTNLLRRVMAGHAHRMIFAVSMDNDVPILRPRVVDAERFRIEADAWQQWHTQQLSIEQKVLTPQAP